MSNRTCMNRSNVKRCKERSLEEAVQLLRQLSESQLVGLEENHLRLLVRLLISTQLQMVSSSTACRKVDQVSLTLCVITVQCFLKTERNLTDSFLSFLTDVATFSKGGPPAGF